MKLHSTTLVLLLLAVFCGSVDLLAKPTAADLAKAEALAAQIKNPAVRAALQCRVAFADTTSAVPIKGRSDAAGAGRFWAEYFKKIRGIDVAESPDEFKTAFHDHLHAVKGVSDSLNNPQARMSSGPSAVTHNMYYAGTHTSVQEPSSINSATRMSGHHDALGDVGETYRAVFTAANHSMKIAPASDGQLASQIDGLLHG